MKHLVELDIPEGKYCLDCILLEAGCSALSDYCRLYPGDAVEADEGGILKHKNCPSGKPVENKNA